MSQREIGGYAQKPFLKSMQKWQEDMKKRTQKILEDIPEIHWEILGYSNGRTKEEVLEKYPEHKEFIDKIVFN